MPKTNELDKIQEKHGWCLLEMPNQNVQTFQVHNVNKGTIFFMKSKLRLNDWVHLIYCWASKMGVRMASRQLGVSEKTIVDCYSFFREICSKYFANNPVKLGGPNVIVQIDESCFSHKVKHHRGRAHDQSKWVFGILDTSTKPGIGYMELVPNRSAEVLLPIIQKVVLPGSIIHSDQWKSYRTLQGMGFEHRTVNHSINFVGPDGVNTQGIESYWNKHKSTIKKMHGCVKKFLPDYLQEFM